MAAPGLTADVYVVSEAVDGRLEADDPILPANEQGDCG
jgi:hypothetical protein